MKSHQRDICEQQQIECYVGDDAQVEEVQGRGVVQGQKSSDGYRSLHGRRSPTVWKGETSTEKTNQVTKHAKSKADKKLTDTQEDKNTTVNGARTKETMTCSTTKRKLRCSGMPWMKAPTTMQGMEAKRDWFARAVEVE